MIERPDIILHLSVTRIIKHKPFKLIFIVPFAERSILTAHKHKLFTRKRHHIHKKRSHTREFVVIFAEHLVQKRFLPVNDFVVRYGKNIIFRKRIHKRESELVMHVFSEKRIGRNILEHIVCPTHIPFEIKPESAIRNRLCHHRPGGGFLRYHQSVRKFREHGGIQFFEERHRLIIVISAVFIRDPFSGSPIIVKIKH